MEQNFLKLGSLETTDTSTPPLRSSLSSHLARWGLSESELRVKILQEFHETGRVTDAEDITPQRAERTEKLSSEGTSMP